MPKLAPPAAILAASVSAVLSAAPARTAEGPWIQVATPHFTLVSNAGEKPAQDLAGQFENVRAVFSAVWPWARREEGRPFIVFVTADEQTVRAMSPELLTGGTWETEDDRVAGDVADFALIRVDRGTVNPRGRENPYEAAYEAYADNVLVRHFHGRMPLWYREGLVEIFGNVVAGAKQVEIGRAIRSYLYVLRGVGPAGGWANREDGRRAPASRALIPLERLVEVDEDDPEFTGDFERVFFGAQAWAFTHFLMFGQDGVHRGAFNKVSDLLRAGRTGDAATREALGDVSRLNRAFREHVDRPAFQYQKLPAVIEIPKQEWPARHATPAEVATLQAHFHVAKGHTRQARESLAAAKAGGGASVHEVEGLLLLREGDSEGARAAFARALEAGSTSPWLVERTGQGKKTAAPANVDHLVGACGKGDEEACRRMAEILTAACEGGDAPSCTPLGYLYVRGRGVGKDVAKGETLYAQACDGGEAKACLALARSIEARSQDPADRSRAAALVAKACAAGVSGACGEAKR